ADRPAFGALLPHAPAVLPPDSNWMADLASYLGFSGGYVAAREFSQAMLAERARVLGPEHPGTLIIRAHLARWTGEAGDAAGARDQLAALLPLYERVLGPEHPQTLANPDHLARWTGGAGRSGGPRDQHPAVR